MNENEFKVLNKATISFNYLHTNSTTHELLLGAIAELVDNSRDASANNLHIDFNKENEYLSVMDDGCGMTQKEAVNVISFGFSNKRNIDGMIGQYGNGLKSGAMRVATDMILLTKKDGQLSCLLLSRTFHKEHNLHEVFVPSPSFNAEDRHMMAKSDEDMAKHRIEMSIIYKYSPFSNQDELFAQFEKIQGEHGTMIVLFNLRRLLSGEFELDFKSTEDDIRLTDQVAQREEEYNSLRSYLSVLYLQPRMKIYLRGKKITATRLTSSLIMKYKYQYLGKNLKACAIKEHEACVAAVKDAEERIRVAQSDFGKFSLSDYTISDKNDRVMQRVLSSAVEEAKNALKAAKEREVAAKKAINNPQPLSIVFGINIHHRNRYGCMFYNNGRLILAYQKGAAQKEKNDLMMKCLGVVGIVDVPYSVLAPTHNKQSFENQREYLSLLKAMNELMLKYWADIGIGNSPAGIKHFWKQYGYPTSDWGAEPIADMEGKRNRFNQTNHYIQCNDCLKWRKVATQMKYMSYGIPEDWKCADHPNASNRNCSAPEEQERIKDGAGKLEKQIEPVVFTPKRNGVVKEELTSFPKSQMEVEIEISKKSPSMTSSSESRQYGMSKRGSKAPQRSKTADDDETDSDDEHHPPPSKRTSRRPAPPPPPPPPPVRKAAAAGAAALSASMSSGRMVGKAPTGSTAQRGVTVKRSSSTVVLGTSEDEEEESEEDDDDDDDDEKHRRMMKKKKKMLGKLTARNGDSKHLIKESKKVVATPSTSNGTTALKSRSAISIELRKNSDKWSDSMLRELLQQFAKKGSKEAYRLLKMNEEMFRKSFEPETLMSTFYEENCAKPLRLAEKRNLSFLEKRGEVREKIVEKTVEVIVEKEKVPKKFEQLAKESVAVLGWLVPHYHKEMNLPADIVIEKEMVFDVMHKMSEVLTSTSEECGGSGGCGGVADADPSSAQTVESEGKIIMKNDEQDIDDSVVALD